MIPVDTILLSEARTLMEARNAHGYAKPFSIGFSTYNRKTDEGGDFVEYEFAMLLDNVNPLAKNSPKKNLQIEREIEKGLTPRNPNHWNNQTKNLAILTKNEQGELIRTGSIHKIHLRNILTFNGKEIIWD